MVLGLKSGELLERRGDTLAVALAVVSLVAKQRHGAGELICQAREQIALRRQIPLEIPEEAFVAAILTKPVTNVARGAEVAFVAVRDAGA